MSNDYGQRALERRNAQQNAEREAKEKAQAELQEQQKSKKEAAYLARQEFREWVSLILGFIGTVLGVISILWQVPLH